MNRDFACLSVPGRLSPAPSSMRNQAGKTTGDDESWLRRWLWPSWSQRKRMLRAEAWAFLVVCHAVIGFAYLWPSDFRNISSWHVAGAWAAFMVRTFLFHLGLVLVVIAAVAAWARSWCLCGASLPVALVTVGPVL